MTKQVFFSLHSCRCMLDIKTDRIQSVDLISLTLRALYEIYFNNFKSMYLSPNSAKDQTDLCQITIYASLFQPQCPPEEQTSCLRIPPDHSWGFWDCSSWFWKVPCLEKTSTCSYTYIEKIYIFPFQSTPSLNVNTTDNITNLTELQTEGKRLT